MCFELVLKQMSMTMFLSKSSRIKHQREVMHNMTNMS